LLIGQFAPDLTDVRFCPRNDTEHDSIAVNHGAKTDTIGSSPVKIDSRPFSCDQSSIPQHRSHARFLRTRASNLLVITIFSAMFPLSCNLTRNILTPSWREIGVLGRSSASIAWTARIVIPCLYPTYIRGEAYLAAGQGNPAAAEFQKVIDHSGIVWNCWTGALAHLGVARANALTARTATGADADVARVRAAYKDFLTLWKDADPNIPILKEAKAEYAKLQ
jgi:hypothetical protein